MNKDLFNKLFISSLASISFPVLLAVIIAKESPYITLVIFFLLPLSIGIAWIIAYFMTNFLSDELEADVGRVSRELRTGLDRLLKEKEQTDALLNAMEEGVIVTDSRGTVTMSNRKADTLLGSGWVGRKVIEVSRNPELHRIIEEGCRKREVVSGEVTLNLPASISLSVTVTPLIWNDERIGSVIVFHDITMLKKLEEMRIDFVANVSHELKTPLTSIRGFAETLKEGALEDKENAGRFLDIIRYNADRLSRLVEDLLTLSNIELGKIVLDISDLDALEVIRPVISTVEPMARAKGLRIDVHLDEGLKIQADRDRLSQVLLNLIDNAIKFTPKGAVTINARNIQDGLIEISVTDTGPGIPPKDIPRLGERFYRVDPARSRELGGTGLGLAIVKHLVGSMNGRFAIESDYGNGTIVRIILNSN